MSASPKCPVCGLEGKHAPHLRCVYALVMCGNCKWWDAGICQLSDRATGQTDPCHCLPNSWEKAR